MDVSVEVELQQVTCWCGISFMVPNALYKQVRRHCDMTPKGETHNIHCPLGHTFTYGVRDEVKTLRDQLTGARAALDQATAELATARTKLAKVAKGTCPECHRHFVNLGRHMASKHPHLKLERKH